MPEDYIATQRKELKVSGLLREDEFLDAIMESNPNSMITEVEGTN